MRYLGQVVEYSYRAQIICKGSFSPPRSAMVYTRTMRPVGKVDRVFGPVDTPYIVVQPLDEKDLDLANLGTDVYIDSEEPQK